MNQSLVPQAEFPVACSLEPAALAARADEVRRELFSGAVERRELDAGYAFRFPGEGDWHGKIADFIASERTCCSFFRFELAFAPGFGPIWLTMTGPAGTKEFIAATFDVPAEAV